MCESTLDCTFYAHARLTNLEIDFVSKTAESSLKMGSVEGEETLKPRIKALMGKSVFLSQKVLWRRNFITQS